MTEANFVLAAQTRSEEGRRASRRMRRSGRIPAVVYGDGKPAQSISLDMFAAQKFLANEQVFSSVISLNLDGVQESVLIRDLQMHPYKAQILHVDFMRVHQGELVTLNVPIHLLNEHSAVGVKMGGGLLHRALTEVEIQAPVGNLPDAIEVDVAALQVGESIHLSDLQVPAGVVLTALKHGDDKEVVSIHAPHGPAADEAEGGAAAE
ncbi:50S ribosomal protein L25/general stress protein Ctc [Candidatus Igneacidithiobacillus taiwanensis]|uniref:50S ribosomal protein L25/general stress protein Ctc n=1 Tax=Candidatus Igneacidithiobacillus taiwanensis TaxID=1945924 RepID=UPI002896C17A|nr:50S ribosomal protein L25/general stress protein Ctc [Candidatus Igneacidithiobacillus taiwanensis]MCE5360357.1 50S ribosomal protein L25/general stress protein Ctc [Acidithiobacillus sp.]